MKNLTLFALLFSMVLLSCNQEPEQLRTPKGYPITFHVGPSEPTAQLGEHAIISFFATSGDTTLMDAPVEQEAKLPKEYNKKADLIGAFLMMGVGDSVTVHVPLDSLPERARQNPMISDGVYYHLKMKEILDSAAYAERKQAELAEKKMKIAKVDSLLDHYLGQYNEGKLSDDLMTLESGLEILMLEEGTGDLIKKGDMAEVNYTGVFMKNGKKFDSSFPRGKGFELGVGMGSVIKGWDEGLQKFNRGGAGILFIPYDLAYGESGRGSIGPNEDLVFYIEVSE